jgi:hypothetical protein
MRRRLAAVLVLTTLVSLPIVNPPPVAQASTACTGWTSTRVPPTTIRVMRTSGSAAGKVQTVNFERYVQVVEMSEWPSSWPAEALQVGAIAVKQYAWYFAMNYRGGTGTGGCYDVTDNTADQVYRPETRIPVASVIAAADATWDVSLTKSGKFMLTGYRAGITTVCGFDTDGAHLFQHSVYGCAKAGMTAEQILHLYYDPIVIWSAPAKPNTTFLSPPEQAQLTTGTSVTASWAEAAAAGRTITSRSLSLALAQPINGSCSVDRWLPAAPAWHSTGVSPQTVTGLQPGLCYRFLLQLTDSNGTTTSSRSGTMLIDPLAPTGSFSAPALTIVTTSATTAAPAWTEKPVAGTTIVNRVLTTEYALQPSAGSCAGALWTTLSQSTSASPAAVSGLKKLMCYRFRVTVTDSAGHTGSWASGDLLVS